MLLFQHICLAVDDIHTGLQGLQGRSICTLHHHHTVDCINISLATVGTDDVGNA